MNRWESILIGIVIEYFLMVNFNKSKEKCTKHLKSKDIKKIKKSIKHFNEELSQRTYLI